LPHYWPSDKTAKKEKYKLASSNHVTILPSKQDAIYDQALKEIFK